MQEKKSKKTNNASAKKCSNASRKKTTERPQELKHDLDVRLSRVEGQLRALRRMVADDAYCDDLLAQIAAARGALWKLSLAVLEHHLKHCLIAHARSGDDSLADEVVDRIRRNFS